MSHVVICRNGGTKAPSITMKSSFPLSLRGWPGQPKQSRRAHPSPRGAFFFCHCEELSPFVIARLARLAEAISGAMRLPRTPRVLATTG